MKRSMKVTLCLLLILSLLTACTGGVQPPVQSPVQPPVQPPDEPKTAYALEQVDDDIVTANTSFAFDIFNALNQEDPGSNLFISPLSISTALAMTYNGAKGSTLQAMEKTLHFAGSDRSVINESFFNLLAHLKDVDDQITLTLANSIWIREGAQIQEAFLTQNRKTFHADIEYLNFAKPDAADIINGWISDATNALIEEMIDPPIPGNVVMYLINAIYFKGQWMRTFDTDLTFDGQFYAQDGAVQTVPMMRSQDTLEFTETEDYKAIRLPYGKGKTSMIAILPEEGKELDDFIAALDAQTFYEIRSSLQTTEEVILQLPRFKIEYGIQDLTDSLTELGMGVAFGPEADFSDMRSGLFISQVLHKAVIEVNEEGSEAAAATVVVMKESAAMDPITFIADRPFIFVILDDITGTILFMGKLASVN